MRNLKYVLQIFVFTIIILLLLVSSPFTKPSIHWYGVDSGLKKAKSLNRPVFIDFYADWCKWCKVMSRETFSNKKVIDIINRHYIAIKVDLGKRKNIKFRGRELAPNQFSAYLGVQGLPCVVFMDKKGDFIEKIPGYIQPKVFLALLGYFKDECYKKKVKFKDYMDGKIDCK